MDSFVQFCFVLFVLSSGSTQFIESVWNEDVLINTNQLSIDKEEKVEIKVYYECLCPDCRQFDSQDLVQVVKKLGGHLNLHTVPYGNAKTVEKNGKITFICQHGLEECYGNKLHACANDALQNTTQAVLFNGCMMDQSQEGHGSDDKAADVCGKAMGLNTESIKHCAKGNRGTVLLKKYGEESKMVNFDYVPYILVNGDLTDGTDFMEVVCKAFKNPPEACKQKSLMDLLFYYVVSSH